jgi:hypothetical protein
MGFVRLTSADAFVEPLAALGILGGTLGGTLKGALGLDDTAFSRTLRRNMTSSGRSSGSGGACSSPGRILLGQAVVGVVAGGAKAEGTEGMEGMEGKGVCVEGVVMNMSNPMNTQRSRNVREREGGREIVCVCVRCVCVCVNAFASLLLISPFLS